MRPSSRLLALGFAVSCASLVACAGVVSPLAPHDGASNLDALAGTKLVPHSPITITPPKLSVVIGASEPVVLAEADHHGTFYSFTPPGKESCKGIAKWTPLFGKGPKLTVHVKGVALGSCTIVFRGGQARTKELPVTVTAPVPPVFVADQLGHAVKTIAPGCISASCVTTLGGGFGGPYGVAADAAGNVFVTDNNRSVVNKIPSGCVTAACVVTLAGGFLHPLGIAVDKHGNVFVGDQETGRNAVKKIPSGCAAASCVTTLGGGFDGPTGLAVDASENVFVADFFNDAVKKIPHGCATTLGGGFKGPGGVALDRAGNVFVADLKHDAVKEIPPGCIAAACVTTLGGGFRSPAGIAVDANGTVYVSELDNDVKEMPSGCVTAACVSTIGGGFRGPSGVAVPPT
jgi:hypothetical protein